MAALQDLNADDETPLAPDPKTHRWTDLLSPHQLYSHAQRIEEIFRRHREKDEKSYKQT